MANSNLMWYINGTIMALEAGVSWHTKPTTGKVILCWPRFRGRHTCAQQRRRCSATGPCCRSFRLPAGAVSSHGLPCGWGSQGIQPLNQVTQRQQQQQRRAQGASAWMHGAPCSPACKTDRLPCTMPPSLHISHSRRRTLHPCSWRLPGPLWQALSRSAGQAAQLALGTARLFHPRCSLLHHRRPRRSTLCCFQGLKGLAPCRAGTQPLGARCLQRRRRLISCSRICSIPCCLVPHSGAGKHDCRGRRRLCCSCACLAGRRQRAICHWRPCSGLERRVGGPPAPAAALAPVAAAAPSCAPVPERRGAPLRPSRHPILPSSDPPASWPH